MIKNKNKIKLEACKNTILKDIYPRFNKFLRKEIPASFANTGKYYGFFNIL
jgi:hypothetical protein